VRRDIQKLESEITLLGGRYYLKAMNCPHHHRIFAAEPRSYRDLPLRLAEYGTCYRYEQSGELFGVMRVRSMNMNDAHIYCTAEQFAEEDKKRKAGAEAKNNAESLIHTTERQLADNGDKVDEARPIAPERYIDKALDLMELAPLTYSRVLFLTSDDPRELARAHAYALALFAATDARAETAGLRGGDVAGPDSVVHPAEVVVGRVDGRIAEEWVRHVVRIEHPVVRHGRRDGRMRGDERYKTEIGTGVGRLKFFDGAGGEPGLAGEGGGHGAELRHVIHVAAFAVDLLEVVEAGCAGAEPRHVVVGEEFFFRGPEFFGVFVRLKTERFVARLGVKFTEAPRPVAAGGEG
jgi:hypothetical protein